jgi:hypothetical protein
MDETLRFSPILTSSAVDPAGLAIVLPRQSD